MSDPGRTASGGSGNGTATPQHSDGARLMAACGEHIDLVVDKWFDDYNARDHDQLLHLLMTSRNRSAKPLVDRPLERELLITRANCLCSPFNSVMITNRTVSGSLAEGMNGMIAAHTGQSTSDVDIMIELGPVDWIFPDTANSSSAEDTTTGAAPTADLGGPDSDPPPRLVITETENPGFVLLLQERRDDCPHQERLKFNAQDVTKVFEDLQRLGMGPNNTPKGASGPAISRSDNEAKIFRTVDYDDVPCLHVAVWFISDEFFTRHRQHNWPPEAVRDNIRQFGLHLVPVGAPGSSTERSEFRISFSRAELILALLLTDRQRHAVIAFKVCRAVVRNGKAIKSYYAKTALLWLCERTPKDDWTTVSQSVIKLLDFLEEAVNRGSLPCYFWSRVNLLRFTSQEEREAMKSALHDMKRNLMTILAREFCVHQPRLQEMLTQTTTQLTERQVRACLARWCIREGILDAFSCHLTFSTTRVVELLVPVLVHSQQFTSSTVAKRLVPFSQRYRLQTRLYQALTVAPADVTLQAHLTSMGPGFVWDAAPLLGLLTEDDLRILLGDPDAVRAWLRRQHQLPETERPAGLPADLRSPRDLCDLLLNIPLLSWALEESQPAVREHQQRLNMEVMGRYLNHELGSYETYHEEGLSSALKWKKMAFHFQTKLGMDRQTALRAACRIGVELRRLLDDPETAREYERRRRRFPDPWGVLPFWLRRPV